MYEVFAGLLFFIGLILAAIGIILLVVNSTARQWWMWALLIGGVVLLVIGAGIWLYGRHTTTVRQTTIEYADDPLMPAPVAHTTTTTQVTRRGVVNPINPLAPVV